MVFREDKDSFSLQNVYVALLVPSKLAQKLSFLLSKVEVSCFKRYLHWILRTYGVVFDGEGSE